MVEQRDVQRWRAAGISGKWAGELFGLRRQSGFRKLDLMEQDLVRLSSQRPQEVRRWLLLLVLDGDLRLRRADDEERG